MTRADRPSHTWAREYVRRLASDAGENFRKGYVTTITKGLMAEWGNLLSDSQRECLEPLFVSRQKMPSDRAGC